MRMQFMKYSCWIPAGGTVVAPFFTPWPTSCLSGSFSESALQSGRGGGGKHQRAGIVLIFHLQWTLVYANTVNVAFIWLSNAKWSSFCGCRACAPCLKETRVHFNGWSWHNALDLELPKQSASVTIPQTKRFGLVQKYNKDQNPYKSLSDT